MPFLPSEGEETKLLINEQMNDVLVFHYLPILWYRYPIPNEIRDFWYKERPDILNYMQKAYKDLDIQFLPDNIVKQLNQESITKELPLISNSLMIQDSSIHHSSSTEMLSINNLIETDKLFTAINFLPEHFHNFVFTSIEKLF
jgi:hypothetical protein